MSWLGIYSYQLKESTIEFYKSTLAYFILFHLMLLFFSCIVFAHESQDFKKKLEAIPLIVAAIQAFGSFLNVALKMKEIKALHLKLQEIVDEGNFFFVFQLFCFKVSFCKKKSSKAFF